MLNNLRHLRGKKVLVTRARGQAAGDIRALCKVGAVPIHIPLIEIIPPEDNFEALDAAIRDLGSYQWIVFTSQNAVRMFFCRLGRRRIPKDIKFACVGPVTARALKSRHRCADVVAKKFSAQGLFEEMKAHVKSGECALWPRAYSARMTILRGLGSLGVCVDDIVSYRVQMPRRLDRSALIKLVEDGGIDAVCFASSQAAKNFAQIVGKKGHVLRLEIFNTH